MKTSIFFYDYFGTMQCQKISKYNNYQLENEIIFEGRKYIVKTVRINEDESIKYVKAFETRS